VLVAPADVAAQEVRVPIVARVPTICTADFVPIGSPSVADIPQVSLGSITTFCNALGGYSIRIDDDRSDDRIYHLRTAADATRLAPDTFRIAPLRKLETELVTDTTSDAVQLAQVIRVEIMPIGSMDRATPGIPTPFISLGIHARCTAGTRASINAPVSASSSQRR